MDSVWCLMAISIPEDWCLMNSQPTFLFLTYLSLCIVFDSNSSNIDGVLWINPSANLFVFGDFNVHQKEWLTYSIGMDRPDELLEFFYLKWPYSDSLLPYLVPSLWLTESCSFRFILIQWLPLWEILIMFFF